MSVPTIAVKESLDDLKEIGPSTGIGGFKLVYVIGKGLYQWQTGDQSSNVPSGNDADNWVAPSEDTSGASGAWQLDDSGILDPEHATDSGTDAFVSATNTTPPGNGATITRDFQSANSTTTPTLDGKTITDRDGNALWAGAINGVHELQYASGTDTYLLLDPRPTAAVQDHAPVKYDSGGRFTVNSPTSGPEVTNRNWVEGNRLALPGTSSDPALSFGSWRTPSASRPTLVSLQVSVQTDGTTTGKVAIDVDESGGTTADYSFGFQMTSAQSSGAAGENKSFSFIVPAGGSYQVRNEADPQGGNSIGDHREFTL